jgi:hypothetical protein
MVTVRNGTARAARKTANNTSEKASRTSQATNGTTTSKTKSKASNSNGNVKKQPLDPVDLAERIVNSVKKLYKVELADRDSRLVRKTAYALREKLGKDIQSQMEKNKRNGISKQSFDWKQWNSEIFPKLVGDPENMTYSAETLAAAASLIYDTIPTETEAAIQSLVEFNLQSLQARNNLNNKNEIDLDSLEDNKDIDSFFDEDDDDDFEISDKDDDDFDLDDDDDFDLDD